MRKDLTDTIVSLSSGPTPSGIAIIRISSPDTSFIRSGDFLSSIFKSKINPITSPRSCIYGYFYDQVQTKIDTGLCCYFDAPNSFTGEEVIEFHVHGSRVVVSEIISHVCAIGGRVALPGEFTKRAYLNGKLDLTQAEAVADVINSTSVVQLKLAEEQMSGRLSTVIADIGEPIRDLLAEFEAGIDFPDEYLASDDLEKICIKISEVLTRIKSLIDSYRYGKTVRDGLRISIVGSPNAGKSSLLNALLSEERAIVTEIPGTTRDTIEESLVIHGYKVVLCDTAGFRDTEHKAEKIGIERSINKMKWCDLIFLVIDSKEIETKKILNYSKQISAESGLVHEIQDIISMEGEKKVWVILNKCDLIDADVTVPVDLINSEVLKLSAKTGNGVAELKRKIKDYIEGDIQAINSQSIITSERHLQGLKNAEENLENFIKFVHYKRCPVEILGNSLSLALVSLDEIIGKTDHEDILGKYLVNFVLENNSLKLCISLES